LALDAKKAKIRFRPLSLALDGAKESREAYLLSNDESCSISGDCDSLLYLRDTNGCYRPLLVFNGKFMQLDRSRGRTLASVEIESRFEADTVNVGGSLRVERRIRRFEFAAKADQYEESK
jgi:hypothetical protein